MYLKKRLEDFGLEATPAEVVGAAPAASLLARLTALEISTIPNDSVARYKKRKLRETKQSGLRAAKLLVEIAGTAFSVSVVLFGLATVLRMFFLKMSNLPVFGPEVFFLTACTVGTLASAHFASMGVEWLSGRIDGYPKFAAAWKRSPYAEYASVYGGRLVPPEIQQRARLVKRALPQAEVSVDWFDKDPFLVVEVFDEEVFIGVWDEEGFA